MEELICKAKNGDKQAYTELIKGLENDLYNIAKARTYDDEDAKDIVQETILIGYLKIGQLRNNKHFKGWIIKILINQCNKFYRLQKRNEEISNKYIEKFINSEQEDFNENRINFEGLITELDEIEQEIFKLYYDDKYTIKEIAKKLNINTNTIKSKLKRGRKRIKTTYQKAIIWILVVGILTAGVVFGRDIINYLKEIFDLSSIGQNNDGILRAIEDKEWVQNVQMDYIGLNENYSIKVNYILMDDINMYMVFELQSRTSFNKYDRFNITDLKITDQNEDVIYDTKNVMDKQRVKAEGRKRIDVNSNYDIQELFYLISDDYSSISKINISFSEIVLFADSNPGNISQTINAETKNINIDIDDKFINRKTIEYIANDKNEEYSIEKAIITDTGFYSIIKTKIGKIKFDLQINDTKYKCNTMGIHFDPIENCYYDLVYTDIDLNNIYDKLILKSKKNFTELYKKYSQQ